MNHHCLHRPAVTHTAAAAIVLVIIDELLELELNDTPSPRDHCHGLERTCWPSSAPAPVSNYVWTVYLFRPSDPGVLVGENS